MNLYKLVYIFIFFGLGILLRFLCFLILKCLYREAPKAYVDIFESYYMHLHSLRVDSLNSRNRTLILIKD